ncbi:hypothetical protein DL767_009491 [Monosporascus sp. MG133]|nr:hypothetical protein DL767_009491 [Monosporascus sp. MG133]
MRECTNYEYDKGYMISESKEPTLYWGSERSSLARVQRSAYEGYRAETNATMCKYVFTICVVCQRRSEHKLTVCDAPKDAGFCEGTQTGPGIGFGKWLMPHKMEKKICTSCLGTIDEEIRERDIKYGKTVATEELTKELTEE